MNGIGALVQSGDWKQEKHIPAIEAPDKVKKDEPVTVTVTVGKELPHPNKTEHHIRWIALFFQPEGEKFPYEIARCEFTAHGESVKGPDTSTVYSQPSIAARLVTGKGGTLLATSYCNIHGLWQSSRPLPAA